MGKQEWFGKWFNSPYYHILYKHRDDNEAKGFIDRLGKFLQFTESDQILDVACGKGRHAIYLNNKGLQVDGIDLSKENILYAQQFSNQTLHFEQWDMRKVFHPEKYDYVLNLFTSFGYFEDPSENLMAMKSMAGSLKPGGTLVLDFLNPYVVINNLIESETQSIEGILFNISRRYENGFIFKNIEFSDNGKNFFFEEKVKAIRRTEFLDYFANCKLEVTACFGDYQLNQYRAEQSERLIFLARK